MSKVQVSSPLVELDGDEMTRVLWRMIKDELLFPYLEIPIEYFDLHLKERDRSEDRVTVEAAEAIKKYGVGVKCATITPDRDRIQEYSLKRAWPSPNATIRSYLGGTVFRKPIIVRNILPAVRSWTKPIVVGRHAYGDIYDCKEFVAEKPGKVEIRYYEESGEVHSYPSFELPGPGVVMCQRNLRSSIESFAAACVDYALNEKMELWFCAKDTIAKKYHGYFREIFERLVKQKAESFKEAGIAFRYLLIDDAAAQLLKIPGGIVLALMNYDGDVWSDLIASGFGSLGLMTSVLVSPDGSYEYEAAHGTVRRHYQQYLQGKQTSTNPVATIFAWTGALTKRAELDGSPAVSSFARALEESVLKTIESGVMTGDLARIAASSQTRTVTSAEFIAEVRARLDRELAQR